MIENRLQDNSQNLADFQPSPEQIAFALNYVRTSGNITESFEGLSVGRNVYYENWRYQKGFKKWLQEYCKEAVLEMYGDWFLWANKYARKGSYKHLALLMEIAKEFAPAPAIVNQIKTIIFSNKNGSDRDKPDNGDSRIIHARQSSGGLG